VTERSSSVVLVQVRRDDLSVPLPAYAREGDAGLDLAAAAPVTLPPGGRALVPTGLRVAIPDGHAGLVLPRSGLALRTGVTVLNAPGLIDSGYRGEIRVVLLNTDPSETFRVAPGDRIAQLVVLALPQVRIAVTDELPDSERAHRGFGSSAVGSPP